MKIDLKLIFLTRHWQDANDENEGDNFWTDVAKDPKLLFFNKNTRIKIMTNFSIEKLVKIFYSREFMTQIVEQTNLYALHKCEKIGLVRRSSRKAV